MLDHCESPPRCFDPHPCNERLLCTKAPGHAGDHANGESVWGPPAPADAQAAYPPSDPRYPGDTSDPNTGAPKHWSCLGCAMTSDAVAELDLAVTFDESLGLCSRCRENLTSVTCALIDTITACGIDAGIDAGGDLGNRMAEIERHLNIDAPENVQMEMDEDDAGSAWGEWRGPAVTREKYQATVRRCVNLLAHRDELVLRAHDAVERVGCDADFAELQGRLNRQQGAIDECRAALGLDDEKHDRATLLRGLGGAFGGGLVGFFAAVSPPKLVDRLLREFLPIVIAKMTPQRPVDTDEYAA